MVASVGRITAGHGYDYLTRDVATSKHDYYVGKGEAPGVWRGDGAALLGLVGEVDAAEMHALYGRFVVPSTAGGVRRDDGRIDPEVVLGRKVSTRRRADGTVAEPVAAFDVTFSPSKSVSVLFGLTRDDAVRDGVIEAHEAAVVEALVYLEGVAGHTRAGAGGVRRVAGCGFVIAQFRHRTARSTDPASRVGDPQLHSHCAILNRVCGEDGKWRTLDGAAIYRHAHAAGALYGAVLERELTQRLGVCWREPDGRRPMREIDGVSEELLSHFSSRRAAVLEHFDALEGEWWELHKRSPTRAERAGMLDEATVRSREPKVQADVDLHEQWRLSVPGHSVDRGVVGRARARRVVDGGRLPAGSAELSDAVFGALHGQRSWWTRAHVTAEVARLVADPTLEVVWRETERIVAASVQLEVDVDDEYADPNAVRFSSRTILDAEARVLAAAEREPAAFSVVPVVAERLGDDQVEAVATICGSRGRVCSVIGPAGAGKTTMLESVAASYGAAGREVMALTLSAAAARVVTQETGLAANTIASWEVGGVDIPRGGLVLVDEASMVPTLTLDHLVRVAGHYGARVALVGDYAQMSAPEAGGLLRDLSAVDGGAQLVSVRRFRSEWERAASIRVRERDPAVAETYGAYGRIVPTLMSDAFDAVAAAWHDDHLDGRASLVVVDSAGDAAAVGQRCQELLRADGALGEVVGELGDGTRLHVGDQIQTRRNDATILTGDGRRVLNRDVWRVTGGHRDGSIDAQHVESRAVVRLPGGYVERDVELAYATTVAGAQGRTVDRGHVLVTPRTHAAGTYVGLTRGRQSNYAHVVTDSHDHDEFELGELTPVQALANAIERGGDGELSASTVRRRWLDRAPEMLHARQQDRRVAHVERWWATRVEQLPPELSEALRERSAVVCAALAEMASDTQRHQAVLAALGAAQNGRSDDPASRFVSTLQSPQVGRQQDRPAGVDPPHRRR